MGWRLSRKKSEEGFRINKSQVSKVRVEKDKIYFGDLPFPWIRYCEKRTKHADKFTCRMKYVLRWNANNQGKTKNYIISRSMRLKSTELNKLNELSPDDIWK